MWRTAAPTLLKQQVDLTRFLLQRMHGMDTHLMKHVRPHLPDEAQYTFQHLIKALDEDNLIDPILHFYVDAPRRVAICARYSTDMQNPMSIEDQFRISERYAAQKWLGGGAAVFRQCRQRDHQLRPQ